MGAVRYGVPLRLCQDLKETHGLTCAVETGTLFGESAVALRSVFDRVWSIELSERFYEEARAANARDGLEFVLGSSEVVLPELLVDIHEPAVFWLDGHGSAGETAGEEQECPVLGELAAINAWPHARDSVVLVDDARYFLGPPPPPHNPAKWPTLLDVLDALREGGERYAVILDDVIIAGPPSIRPTVERYWLDVLRRADEPAPALPDAPPAPAPASSDTERVAQWARSAWRDLPPSESARRAFRHLRAAPETIRRRSGRDDR